MPAKRRWDLIRRLRVKCRTAIVYTDGKQLNESFTILSKGHSGNQYGLSDIQTDALPMTS